MSPESNQPPGEARASIQPDMSAAIDAIAEAKQIPRPDVIRDLLSRGIVDVAREAKGAELASDGESLMLSMRSAMTLSAVPLFLVPMLVHQDGAGSSEIITVEAKAEPKNNRTGGLTQLRSAYYPIANGIILDMHYQHQHGGAEPFVMDLALGGGANLLPTDGRYDLTEFEQPPRAPSKDKRNYPWESKLRQFPLLITPNTLSATVGCRPRILTGDGGKERIERHCCFRLWAVVTPIEYGVLFAWKARESIDQMRGALRERFPHLPPADESEPSTLPPDLLARVAPRGVTSPHFPFAYPSENGDQEG